MSKLRRNSERFFYNHRNKGIPNLMLYIAIGNVLVYLFSMIDPSNLLYLLFRFDRTAILHGEVWRLFSYVFVTLNENNLLFGAIALFLYFQFGRMLEQSWGVCKFTCYYFAGMILLDLAALAIPYSSVSASYLNAGIFLAVATLMPEMRVLVFFIIPVKLRWLALLNLAITLYGVITGLIVMAQLLPLVYLGWLLPLVALANYFLFFGREVVNVFPERWRYRRVRTPKKARPSPGWADNYRSASGEKPYRFRCTVCGRTDTAYPNLEFRYCSRCTGYRCYCSDHINSHPHITE